MSDLPVEEVVGEVRDALAGPARAAVLQAPPGAGKTTIVPLRLLDEPWLAGGDHDRIIVLEPRRLATRGAARRMAASLGEDVGGLVGYRTRDDHRTSRRTRIEVVTEGILTRRIQHDPTLPGTGLVVFDELHERNLQSDLALAFALEARASIRPDLRVLAMSATLDTTRVADLIGAGTPVITSAGRQHPVEVRWAPLLPRARLVEGTVAAVLRALRDEPGDVLVFLPGAGEITRAQRALDDALGPASAVDVRPLYGALSTEAQDHALQPSPPGRRRIVLATDIAETSLTVAGVRIVVDAGQARRPRYDARTGLTRLQTGPASKASADQRTGRAGRTGPGVAYRLWSTLEHAARRPQSAPEIAEVDLAGFALDVAIWGADPAALALLDPPPPRALAEGRELLRRLGAIDADGRPTEDGRRMAELPLHPRLAHLVIRATALGPPERATGCALAALIEDRDILRGHRDEVAIDAAERVRLIVDRSARHHQADGGAVAGARRRAGELLRRVGDGGRLEDADPDLTGLLLALAYPDRIAQARGNGRFRLRNGTGAWVPATDPLGHEAFLVAADVQADRRADGRVRLAAALDVDDVITAAGADVTRATTLSWDADRADLRLRIEERLDDLVLRTSEGPADPDDPRTVEAMVDHVRATRLEVLPWTDAARDLQRRAAFAAVAGAAGSEDVPPLDDGALLRHLADWLEPTLRARRASTRGDLERLDVHRLLIDRLGGHHVAHHLDDLVPRRLRLARGREVAIDYVDDRPTVRVRVQDAFGTATTPGSHPTVAGRPVVFELLSPAGRPVQVTADLPRFWTGSWLAVRKDLAGRYPKHEWPERPSA